MTKRALSLFALTGLMISAGAIACSSDDSSSGTTSDGGAVDSGVATDSGSNTTDSGSSDTGAADTGSNEPDKPPTTDLLLDAKAFGSGKYYITGTIHLPSGASSSRYVSLNIIRTDGDISQRGNYMGTAGQTKSSGDTLTYAITGLAAGTYKVEARVDQTGNLMFGDIGDYDGYARGTVDAPKTAVTADSIALSASLTGVDFGLAVLH